MNPVSTVGLDLAKYIFQLHGADSAGADRTVGSQWNRRRVLPRVAGQYKE